MFNVSRKTCNWCGLGLLRSGVAIISVSQGKTELYLTNLFCLRVKQQILAKGCCRCQLLLLLIWLLTSSSGLVAVSLSCPGVLSRHLLLRTKGLLMSFLPPFFFLVFFIFLFHHNPLIVWDIHIFRIHFYLITSDGVISLRPNVKMVVGE